MLGVKSAAMRSLALGILSLLTSARCTFARKAALQETSVRSLASGSIIEHTWHVTVGSQAPDCFQRDVLLVNGEFQPLLEVVQGEILKVDSIPDATASPVAAVPIVVLVACMLFSMVHRCCGRQLCQIVLLMSLAAIAAMILCDDHPHTDTCVLVNSNIMMPTSCR